MTLKYRYNAKGVATITGIEMNKDRISAKDIANVLMNRGHWRNLDNPKRYVLCVNKVNGDVSDANEIVRCISNSNFVELGIERVVLTGYDDRIQQNCVVCKSYDQAALSRFHLFNTDHDVIKSKPSSSSHCCDNIFGSFFSFFWP